MPSSPVFSGAASPTPGRACTERSNDYGRSVVSRDELNASQLAELAALDRILAREPVDEEHLELAALVDSVRASAPRMGSDFAAHLDSQITSALDRSGARRLRVPRLGLRRLAFASGGVVAAAVALTIVISGGLLDGASNPPTRSTPRGQGQAFEPALKHSSPQSSTIAPLTPASGASTIPGGDAGSTGATTAAGVAVTGPFGVALASNSGASPGTGSSPRL